MGASTLSPLLQKGSQGQANPSDARRASRQCLRHLNRPRCSPEDADADGFPARVEARKRPGSMDTARWAWLLWAQAKPSNDTVVSPEDPGVPDLRPLPSRLTSGSLLTTNVFSCRQVAAV